MVTLMAMAGGYWVNDVFDFKIDQINKPKKVIVGFYLSSKKVLTVYFVVQIICLLISGIFLPWFVALHVGVALLLLFVYAWFLKRISVAGNLVISTLTTMVVLIAMALFSVKVALIWLSVFAFEVTFIREVIKDMEDIRGDLRFKLKTLPIQAGLRTTRKIVALGIFLFIFSCWLPLLSSLYFNKPISFEYLLISLLLVQIPSILGLALMRQGKRPKDYRLPGNIFKWVIGGGVISILFLP